MLFRYTITKILNFFVKILLIYFLKYNQHIDQSKKHYLILKIAILSFESCLLFIAFLKSYLKININEI